MTATVAHHVESGEDHAVALACAARIKAARAGVQHRRDVMVVLNGTVPGGYSGGDLHAVAVLNRWAQDLDTELVRPRHASAALLELVTAAVTQRQATHSAPRRSLLGAYAARTLATTLRLARGCSTTVLVASSHFPFDLVPVSLARGARLRLVYWHHHAGSATQRGALRRVLLAASETLSLALVRRRGVRVLTSNPTTRDHLVARGVPRSRIALTTNAPSTGAAPLPAPTSPLTAADTPAPPFALFCGRLAPQKGTGDLRRIVRRLRQLGEALPIVVCGDGPDRSALQRDLIDVAECGDVRVLGFVGEDHKQRLLADAHVLLFPSHEEGWGISVGEALDAGCRVVAYDLPAVRAAYPSGPVYVARGDVEAFVAAVRDQLGRPRLAPVLDATAQWDAIAEHDLATIATWLQEA